LKSDYACYIETPKEEDKMKKENDLFDWKHSKLWRMSFAADLWSSIVIIVFIFLSLGEVYRYNQFAHSQFQTNLLGLFSQEPIYILDVSLQMLRVLVEGAIYYLVLKAIALGLNMIVETDINYRDKSIEEGIE
jgi:hypothetical protein